MKDLGNYRKSYEKSELLETSIPEDPINLFHKWSIKILYNEKRKIRLQRPNLTIRRV